MYGPLTRASGGLVGLIVALLAATPTLGIEPDDPGKGFDYVFWGFSPPFGPGGPENRAVLLIDIDDPDSPRAYPGGPEFKLSVHSLTNSGRLDVDTAIPNEFHTLLPETGQADPDRFVFGHREIGTEQGDFWVRSNSVLEPDDRHYLRGVIDVVHDGRRTRYLVNCPVAKCDEP